MLNPDWVQTRYKGSLDSPHPCPAVLRTVQ